MDRTTLTPPASYKPAGDIGGVARHEGLLEIPFADDAVGLRAEVNFERLAAPGSDESLTVQLAHAFVVFVPYVDEDTICILAPDAQVIVRLRPSIILGDMGMGDVEDPGDVFRLGRGDRQPEEKSRRPQGLPWVLPKQAG